MNEATEQRAKQIFQQALDRPASARQDFLERICGDGPLRKRVDLLLEVHSDLGDFLAGEPKKSETREREGIGTVIDHYKLLQQIGEGGFGTVYMAEQREPVRRKVALKVIKLGMDTKQVIARFEAERQALALMNHANIAKVLDAGATETGRPYFVMELVKGVPITEYCDQAKVDLAGRLALFGKVCQAVQHAHQKGIIHRDIKPSNVMVTLHDGQPVPKVIDFGIAKATDHRLTEKTLFTEFRQMIGTPDYMAPEQAELSGLDIDTRADIYSLGVLLYELLTGTKPFDLTSLLEKGYDEILRTIREVDPPKPSTRASTTDEATVHAKMPLAKTLRGDLDSIVMKALEKDRSRRYETANAFAADIGRYLTDEPVLATPPSTSYRAGKYIKRNRVAVTLVALIFGALILSGGLAYAASDEAKTRTETARIAKADALRKQAAAEKARAREQEQRARAETGAAESKKETKRAETLVEFIEQMLSSADPQNVKGRNYTVRQLLDDFDRDLKDQLTDEPEVEAMIHTTMGEAYRGLGLPDEAALHANAALAIRRRMFGDEHVHVATSLNNLALALADKGDFDDAERLFREALLIQKREFGDEHAEVAKCLNNLASLLNWKGEYDQAKTLHREALAIQRKVLGGEHADVATSLSNMAGVFRAEGDYDEAEKLCREALAIHRKALGEASPQVASSLNNLGVSLHVKGDYDGAEQCHRDALAILRKAVGEEHPDVAKSLNNLAEFLRAEGHFNEAEKLHREALAIARKALGGEHPQVASSLHNLALVLHRKEAYAEAERLNHEALAIRRKALGEEHADVAASLVSLAVILQTKERYNEAEKLFHEALAILRKALGEEHREVALSLSNLAAVLYAKGRFNEAEELYRDALAIWRKTQGDDHPDGAAILNGLAELVFRAKGNVDEAEKLHGKALAIRRKALGDDHSDVAQSLSNLAGVFLKKENYDEAEKLFRDALAIQRKALGDEHPHVTNSLAGLIIALLSKKDYPAAESVVRELLGRDRSHRWLAVLGMCLLKQDKHAEAEPVLRNCLAVRTKEAPGLWIVYSAMSMLGEALAGQGKHAEAEPLLLEAYKKMAPQTTPAIRKREALERIVKLYEAWEKPEKAAEWRAKQ